MLTCFFASAQIDCPAKKSRLLGVKGATLDDMAKLGLPVPPGFTVSTEVGSYLKDNDYKVPLLIQKEVDRSLVELEKRTGKHFGNTFNPLLLSIRPSTIITTPGMISAILNLGLNETIVEHVEKEHGFNGFAWETYLRFIISYSKSVLGIDDSEVLSVLKKDILQSNLENKSINQINDIKSSVKTLIQYTEQSTGNEFPTDPKKQLWNAIETMFKAWNHSRTRTYRQHNKVSAGLGVAVNIQAMVFGNAGSDCASGTVFSRNPLTGDRRPLGSYLTHSQNTDLLPGIRTPKPISVADDLSDKKVALENLRPSIYANLLNLLREIESSFHDLQKVEFVIEHGKIWILNATRGRRTDKAATQIAIEMLDEKLIDEKNAILNVAPSDLDHYFIQKLSQKSKRHLLTKGGPASPGCAVGRIVFSTQEALESKSLGQKCILVCEETSPLDIEGMLAAEGVLNSKGGLTSHAAVVARGIGKCFISGATGLTIDSKKKQVQSNEIVLQAGDILTLDGSTGEIHMGQMDIDYPELTDSYYKLMEIADKHRQLTIRANADTPYEAALARKLGAEGIGLCRTEHMFNDSDRIDLVRLIIIADNEAQRQKALDKLLPIQKDDFCKIFHEMDGFPVTIRLLDLPLHEFLPKSQKDIDELVSRLDLDRDTTTRKIQSLSETNPMLGHRGCRLAITYPEIYIMQARAIALAISNSIKKGIFVIPEILIPLVTSSAEVEIIRNLITPIFDQVMSETETPFEYSIGSMIESPRAAVTADKIANNSDFLSFGTNDLTQTTLGLSRDDSGAFMGAYTFNEIYKKDPFLTIDIEGVGHLIKTAIALAKKSKSEISLSVCGEHSGDHDSINFFHQAGIDYISCAPTRLPYAKLSAAHISIANRYIPPS